MKNEKKLALPQVLRAIDSLKVGNSESACLIIEQVERVIESLAEVKEPNSINIILLASVITPLFYLHSEKGGDCNQRKWRC